MSKITLLTSILGFVAGLVTWYLKISVTDIAHLKELLSATISMGAIAVGFLAAAITLMPTLQSNNLLMTLKKLGSYHKILNALLSSILMLFILCLFSLIGLFLDTEKASTITNWYLYLWVFFFVNSVSVVSYVIWVFMYYLKTGSEYE